VEHGLLQGSGESVKKSLKVSVAIPLHNEEECLPELYERLRDVLNGIPGGPHEIVFADDGSTDGTAEILETLAKVDTRVVAVRLSRNFGHQAALTAALDHVSGDVVVLMDGDLQDTPETIPQFLEKHAEGYDVVYAIRVKRKEPLWLRCSYAGAYRVIAWLADIDLPRGAGDFSLISRRVIDQIRQSTERHRYLRGLRTWVGYRQIGIPVERAARSAGESKYNLRGLIRLACDGIFSFSVLPLRAASLMGFITITLSAAFAFYNVVARLFLGIVPEGFTALICSLTFLSGVQMLFLGIIGEYVGRVYEEVKRRPKYVVDQVLRGDELAAPIVPRKRASKVGAQSRGGGRTRTRRSSAS
jgi:glycosyltransferase involved in cell wall biosynthesis